MDLTLLLVILVVLMAAVGMLAVFLTVGNPLNSGGLKQQAAVSDSLRSLVQAQRERSRQGEARSRESKDNLALAAAAESTGTRKDRASSSRLTLEKLLRYAKWRVTPLQFRAVQAVLTTAAFIPAYLYGTLLIQALVLFLFRMFAPAFLVSQLEDVLRSLTETIR